MFILCHHEGKIVLSKPYHFISLIYLSLYSQEEEFIIYSSLLTGFMFPREFRWTQTETLRAQEQNMGWGEIAVKLCLSKILLKIPSRKLLALVCNPTLNYTALFRILTRWFWERAPRLPAVVQTNTCYFKVWKGNHWQRNCRAVKV